MSLTLQDILSQYFNFNQGNHTEDSDPKNYKDTTVDTDAYSAYESWNEHISSCPHHDYDSGVYDEYSSEDEDEKPVKKFRRTRGQTISFLSLLMFFISCWLAFYIRQNDSDIFTAILLLSDHNKAKSETVTESSNKLTKKKKWSNAKAVKKSQQDEFTNFFDQTILKLLDEGEQLYRKKKYLACEDFFDKLMNEFPKSPRAVLGKAKCIEKDADKKRSESRLTEAFRLYEKLIDIPNAPVALLRTKVIHMAERRIKFGHRQKAVQVYEKLSKVLTNDLDVLKNLAVSHLYIPNYYEALDILFKIFRLRPDGWVKVHIGYTYKMVKNFTEAIRWLEDGMKTEDDGVHTARFYVTLADTYYRMGNIDRGREIYTRGAEKGLFLSMYQRSIYNSAYQLRAQPWWTAKEAGIQSEAKYLRLNWRIIFEEAMQLLSDKGYYTSAPQLIHYGNWLMHTIVSDGKKKSSACARTPQICSLIEDIKIPLTNQRGDVSINVLDPMTHIWPHTGPTNCRLRLHLAISVPEEGFIRVADHQESWRVGRTLLFDDSFEYEMWNNSTNRQLLFLSIDFWHPDVPESERETLHTV